MSNTFWEILSWKIYFWIFVVRYCLLFIFDFNVSLEDSAAHVFFLLGTHFVYLCLGVALFAYSWQKRIFNQVFWQVIAVINIYLFCFFLLVRFVLLFTPAGSSEIIFLLKDFFVLLPAYGALYMYAFQSPALWPQPATAKRKLLLWKIYFWIFSTINVLFAVSSLFDPGLEFEGWLKWLLLFASLLTLISLIGLYAFSWRKRILQPIFWQILFVVNTIFTIVAIVYTIRQTTSKIINDPEYLALQSSGVQASSETAILVITIIFIYIVLVPFIPAYIANYLYAFKSKALWQKQTTN